METQIEIKKVNRGILITVMLLSLLCGGIIPGTAATAGQGPIPNGSDRGSKISNELKTVLANRRSDEQLVRVIISLSENPRAQLTALLNRNGVYVRAHYRNLGNMVVDLPGSAIAELQTYSEVTFISGDTSTRAFGHVTATTGADAVRVSTTSGLLGTVTTSLDGTGIGIAIVDSGIDVRHTSFLDKSNGVRVAVSRDFTGEGRTDDPFGHGTHVAATAAGNGRIANGTYMGIAPNAKLLNLRVLDKNGVGKTSSLLSSIDWIIANRSAYNIRVVNMSLGSTAVDSYKYDPTCKAVRRLVDAGIVVVAAAGNNGKNGMGQKVYGSIHSPGNEPSALTVGASNTFGSDARSDDVVTTYSSRGPTRSSWTDTSGAKHYDNQLKPDLVAPGNKLVFAKTANNQLVMENPQLAANVSPVDVRDMMYMNGTSMSAPVAAGAAALRSCFRQIRS
ncbi:MAG: S8 family serine peptidase [Pyrinomonadaceae bacterium]